MKTNAVFGAVILSVAALTALAVFYAKHSGFGSEWIETGFGGSEKAPASDALAHDTGNNEAQSLAQRVELLEAKVRDLEFIATREQTTLLQEAAQPAAENDGDPAGQAGPGAPGAAAATATLSESTKQLIRNFLREERSAQNTQEPKLVKKVSEAAQEIGLDNSQEQQLQDLQRDLANEVMKVLFDVEGDQGLDEVRQQLRAAEYDPALRAALGEKIAVNLLQSQNEVIAIGVKNWNRAKKFLSDQQLQELSRYQLQPDSPEWPDLESLLNKK